MAPVTELQDMPPMPLSRLYLLSLILSGCGEKVGNAAPKTELQYASMKDVRNINPHLHLGEMAAQAMVFEPLVKNTPEGVKPPAGSGREQARALLASVGLPEEMLGPAAARALRRESPARRLRPCARLRPGLRGL